MESFRIVDFLSPVAPGWIYDGRRTRKRTSRDVPAVRAAREAPENIKGYYLNSRKSPLFAPATTARVLSESVIGNPSRGRSGQRGEKRPESILFRIINVKNILEAFINVGCKEHKRGTRQVAIGFQLENDYSCRVTVVATWARLSPREVRYSLHRAVTRRKYHEKGTALHPLSFPSSFFTLKIFCNLTKKFKRDLISEIIKIFQRVYLPLPLSLS